MDERTIRLKIVESLISVAPRNEIQSPDALVEKAKVLEKYVVGEPQRKKPGPKPKHGNQQNQS